MIKDKLDTTYTLTIRPEYQGLIPLVAKMNGWDMSSDPKEFLSGFINNYLKNYMKELIHSSLTGYYGVSQAALIEQALLAYDDSAVVASIWSQVVEEDPPEAPVEP